MLLATSSLIVATYGGEAIWPFHGTGSLGYIQGLEGFAGRRFFNILGASAHDPTICSAAGRAGTKYTLGTAECLGSCGTAPMFQINGKAYYENLTIAKVDEILAGLN